MATTFRDALLDRLNPDKGITLRKVCEGSGVSYEQMKKLKARPGASTNVDDARKVANWFGLTLDEFLGDRTVSDRIEIVEEYNRLSPEERRILRAARQADLGADQDKPH